MSDTSFTTSEVAQLLFKKNLGAPQTLETTAVFSEPVRPARAAVFQNQIYAESIPPVAPSDIVSATVDDLGAALAGSVAGITSTASKMIRRYKQVPLTVIPGTLEHSYECALDPTYGRVLQSAVPFNVDPLGSYLYTLYKNDGVTVIPFGVGDWVLDSEAGVLTFYSYNSPALTGVSALLPPKISFYRYVGAIGAATASQTVSSIQNSVINFQKPITFSGGTEGSVDDGSAIVLDDRDLSVLSSATPALTLQIGGDYDGSWRICTVGGSGDPLGTSFQIQVRVSGAWVSKQILFP
jgi:hypothetical protein